MIRVFVAEDSPGMHELIAELLVTSARFELVGSAATEAEARHWLQEHPADWDLAIVDLVLREGSGFGVVERARQVNKQSPVLVFSGYLSPGVTLHCLELGATAVLDKAQANSLLQWLADVANVRRTE
ncbi:MAG TPA: response regulator [Ramlibacter sp.]|uniref:response regulator n=1 Tax=Ramlibacter sp. TaxID=1917967 RepID=UPI002ED060FC